MGASERAAHDRGLSDPSIVRVRAVIEAGLATLEDRRAEVNQLNLGGPADGDTGDNMVLTLRAVLAELDRLAGASAGRTIDEIGRAEIVASVARAALLGARGNSGVILSQLIRGAAEELASRPGELIDPVLVGAALARAADQAYGSVRDPAEGTMLTVVREMAHRVATELAHRSEARLAPETTALEQDLVIAEVIQSALEAGEAAARRPRSGRGEVSVDAGGYGLVVLVAGILSALRGGPVSALAPAPPPSMRAPLHHASITYRWCLSFAVIGEGLSARAFRPALESLGDAVLVIGDEATLKVHVHTDDPEAATALFADAGQVTQVEVADMGHAVPARAPAPVATCELVVATEGDGMHELFEGFGARVIEDPEGLAAALAAPQAREAVVLPGGVVEVTEAREIAGRADRPVEVIAAATPQAALAAAAAFSATQSATENIGLLAAAAARVRTGAVRVAGADDPAGRYTAGEALGEVEEEIVAWGEPAAVLGAVLGRLSAGAEIVSCLSGAAPPLDEPAVRELAARVGGGVGFTTTVGGQSAAWWLLSAQ